MKLSRAERIFYAVLALACTLAVLRVAALIGPGPDSRAPEKSARFGTGVITVDVGKLPTPDCWFEVGAVDSDGRPGGRKVINAEPVCP